MKYKYSPLIIYMRQYSYILIVFYADISFKWSVFMQILSAKYSVKFKASRTTLQKLLSASYYIDSNSLHLH